MTTVIDAMVYFTINGFIQIPPYLQSPIKEFNVPKVGDTISPFLQSYVYKIKSIKEISLTDFLIDLEPFCDNAKEVFRRQYKQYMQKLTLQQIDILIRISIDEPFEQKEDFEKLIVLEFVKNNDIIELSEKGNKFLKTIVNLSETM